MKLLKLVDRLNPFLRHESVDVEHEIPKQLHVETTNICNADCVFCAYRYDKRKKKIMSEEQLRKILTEYRDIGGTIVNFTPYAGEVFSDRRFLQKVKIANELGFDEINTYSNITLIDKFGVDEVLQSGLTYIAVSTSPLDKESYSSIFQSHLYERMLENLVQLAKRYHELENKTVKKILISFRSDRPIEKIRLMKDYEKIEPYIHGNVKEDCMQTFDTWMGVIKETDLLPGMQTKSYDFKKPKPCDRLYMLKVTSNGKMRACGCRYDYSKQEDNFYIGHTDSMTLAEGYNSKRVHELKQSFVDGNIPDECRKCSWYESFRYEGENYCSGADGKK